MKTALIIYAICTLICFIRLAVDKETTSFKKFLNYWYYPFIPFYNLVMVGFIIKDLWKADKVIFVCCTGMLAILILFLTLLISW